MRSTGLTNTYVSNISAFRSPAQENLKAEVASRRNCQSTRGARSMATGRLMETWTHSRDLADTFGVAYPQTDRLRNIAHLGVVTRDFSYVNQGLTPPDEPVRVELTGPDGDVWAWGPSDAANRVVADAYEFCKVLTRRQPLAASVVKVQGPIATKWMEIAQPWIEPP